MSRLWPKEAIRAVEDGEMQFFVPKSYERPILNGCAISSRGVTSPSIVVGTQMPIWYGPDGENLLRRKCRRSPEAAAGKTLYGKPVELTCETDVLDYLVFFRFVGSFSTMGLWDQK